MLRSFLLILVREMLHFLKSNPGFFEKEENARREKIKDLKIPTPFIHYLVKSSEKEFLDDLRIALEFIRTGSGAIKENALFKALLQLFTGSFGLRIDMMSRAANLSEKDRSATAEKLIESDSALAQTLRRILLVYSYQEIATEMSGLSKKVVGAPTLIVQSPRAIELELKKEIRETLGKEHPLSFPIFQINRQLIGGFRVFKEGETTDYSWLSRVLSFKNFCKTLSPTS